MVFLRAADQTTWKVGLLPRASAPGENQQLFSHRRTWEEEGVCVWGGGGGGGIWPKINELMPAGVSSRVYLEQRKHKKLLL